MRQIFKSYTIFLFYSIQYNVILIYHLKLYRHMAEWKRERLSRYSIPFPGNMWDEAHTCRYRATVKLHSVKIVY